MGHEQGGWGVDEDELAKDQLQEAKYVGDCIDFRLAVFSKLYEANAMTSGNGWAIYRDRQDVKDGALSCSVEGQVYVWSTVRYTTPAQNVLLGIAEDGTEIRQNTVVPTLCIIVNDLVRTAHREDYFVATFSLGADNLAQYYVGALCRDPRFANNEQDIEANKKSRAKVMEIDPKTLWIKTHDGAAAPPPSAPLNPFNFQENASSPVQTMFPFGSGANLEHQQYALEEAVEILKRIKPLQAYAHADNGAGNYQFVN